MFSQLVLSPGLKPWSQLNSPIPMKVGMLTATGDRRVRDGEPEDHHLWTDDGRSSRSGSGAQATRRVPKQPGYGRVLKPWTPEAIAVPHLATVRFGRAAKAEGVDKSAKPVTAGGARDIAM